MTEENKAIFVARLKSFGWRLGCFLVVQAIGYVANSLTNLNLSQPVLDVIAYGLGEVTKYVNDHVGMFGAARKS